MTLGRRLQGYFWQYSQLIRKPLRWALRSLSVVRYRIRAQLDPELPPRIVVSRAADGDRPPVDHPALVLSASGDLSRREIDAFLAGQTENSILREPIDGEPEYILQLERGCSRAPAQLVESLLIMAVVEDLDVVAESRCSSQPEPPVMLLRRPRGGLRRIVGRLQSRWCGQPDPVDGRTFEDLDSSGPYLLVPGSRSRVVRHQIRSAAECLRRLPAMTGPRTVLFLVAYMAVGGAERLLLDLLAGLADRYRTMVVCLDPHRSELGEQLSAAAAITPHVYPLGDWLPREGVFDALRHFLRRYRVETLVSWNPTVDFFDRAGELRREFPSLRILSQLYNHRGSWIERLTPSLLGAVDCHLAINTPISKALIEGRGISPEKVALVEHGVAIPPRKSAEELAEDRAEMRRRVGLPRKAVVIGSFLRLHPQKRPHDIVELAERFAGRDIHFLIVGGGPLEAEIDLRLRQHPLDNVTRLPLQTDIEPFFDAVDICLLTSEFEGLPVFLLEGLARGIPCVGTAVGDIPRLLADGGGDGRSKPGDLDALETAIEALLDPQRRHRQGEIGRATIEESHGLKEYCERYRTCIFPIEKVGHQ